MQSVIVFFPASNLYSVTLDADNIGKGIKGDPRELKFTIDGVPFKPFYDSYGRHSVYLDVRLK